MRQRTLVTLVLLQVQKILTLVAGITKTAYYLGIKVENSLSEKATER
jgi:hypothetical protein